MHVGERGCAWPQREESAGRQPRAAGAPSDPRAALGVGLQRAVCVREPEPWVPPADAVLLAAPACACLWV